MPDPRDLTTLSNAKAWLNIPATQTSEDALLTRLVTAESLLFLQAINRANLNQATYTEKRNGSGGSALMMRNYPIISVQSLTIDTVSIPASPDGVRAAHPAEVEVHQHDVRQQRRDHLDRLLSRGTGGGDAQVGVLRRQELDQPLAEEPVIFDDHEVELVAAREPRQVGLMFGEGHRAPRRAA